jgi:hypothetical protein
LEEIGRSKNLDNAAQRLEVFEKNVSDLLAEVRAAVSKYETADR